MVSNRLLQDCLEDFHNIMRLNMALYDRNCTCVAGEEEKAPELDIFHTFCDSAADMQALGTRYLFKVGAQEPTYIQWGQQGYLPHGTACSKTAGTNS